jgi:hypothetical protein
MIFNKWPRWPMMAVLAFGLIFLWTQNGYRYLFAPRIHATVETCGTDCFVSWSDNGKAVSAVVDGADGLTTGQTLDVYPVGDIGHVTPADATPAVIWVFVLVVLLYLVLVALRVTRATANRRRAREEGKRTHRAGELAVLTITLGLPVPLVGGLLMLGDDSRSAGLVVLLTGVVILVGSASAYLAANWGPPADPAGAS